MAKIKTIKLKILTIIFLFFWLIFGIFFFPVKIEAASSAQLESAKLELVYPTIPGVSTPTKIKEGLPVYIRYIFHLAISLVGFTLFGVLIYNGILYLTSAGSREKLIEAKRGIFAGFLGVLILLCSFLLFQTINPKLVVLTPPEIKVIEPKIPAGVYLCNYKVSQPDNIKNILSNYIGGASAETRIKAAKDFWEIVEGGPDKKGRCWQVQKKGSLTKKQLLKANEEFTLFVVPEKIKGNWQYNYGIVLHEKDKREGKCYIFYPANLDEIPPSLKVDFRVSAVTPFIKTDPNESGDIFLYEGINFNKVALPEKKIEDLAQRRITSDLNKRFEEINFENENFTGTTLSLKRNIRSFIISKADKDYYFIIFKGAGSKECKVMEKRHSPNLMLYRVGRCEKSSNKYCTFLVFETEARIVKECEPCIESMVIVQGKIL